MSKPIQTSDLIFPELATNFSSTLASLKRSTLSISNRLRSISEDAEFVCQVADAYALPLIANERCGSWYIPPDRKAASAYFKSTDGHNGEWSMSLRRLNTQVFEVVDRGMGCVIVDSTRRGKSMPDALSKTVPIWCAVWNRVLFPGTPEAHALHTPRQCVSPSEHSQIERRLDDFVSKLKELELDLVALRKVISRPMRPVWITRDSNLLEEAPKFAGFYPIVLCTASRRVHGTEVSEGGYIQGAGDDSEGWSQGLTAGIFWKHKNALISTADEDLPNLITTVIDADKTAKTSSEPVLIQPSNWLFVHQIHAINSLTLDEADGTITCAPRDQIAQVSVAKGKHLHLECRDKKLGSRDLRKEFSKLAQFMNQLPSPNRLLVCCTTGKDLSIGAALAILCLYADEQGNFTPQANSLSMSKAVIRQRLSWIMTSFPEASPSRATLQSVNDFLLTHSSTTTKIVQPTGNTIVESLSISDMFQSLSGEWAMDRELVNFRDDGLAGRVTGLVTFQSHKPTSPDTEVEFLNVENGKFVTTTGLILPATRRWIWRCQNISSTGPRISVHFVKADGETEDYVYNILAFPQEENYKNRTGETALKVKAEHPCGEDFYVSTYEFHLGEGDQTRVSKFKVQHEVKGPSKDYISRTMYSKSV